MEKVRIPRGVKPITEETVLEHPTRRQIFELILENPGISRMEIAKSVNISGELVLYHINKLRDYHPIGFQAQEKSVTYYSNLNHTIKVIAKKYWAILEPNGNVKPETISEERNGAIEKIISTQSKCWKTMKRNGYKCHRVLVVPVDTVID